jgi:hypothetical protein
MYLLSPPSVPNNETTKKGVTHLTTLKQTASTGCKNSKIFRWISGGTARKGTLFGKFFQASVATGMQEGRRLVLARWGGMTNDRLEGIVWMLVLVLIGIIDEVVKNLSFALMTWRRTRKSSRETRSCRVVM